MIVAPGFWLARTFLYLMGSMKSKATSVKEYVNGEPLLYPALASQKSHPAVYPCNVYAVPALRKELEAGWVIGKRFAATSMNAFVRVAEDVYKKRN